MTVLGYLGFGFLGLLLGIIVTTVILVKKNGKQYAQIGEEVRNERTMTYEENPEEYDSSDDSRLSGDSAESDSEESGE